MAERLKPLRNLTDEDIERMSTEDVIARLKRLNPFGGYSKSDRPDVLRRTLANYRDRA